MTKGERQCGLSVPKEQLIFWLSVRDVSSLPLLS